MHRTPVAIDFRDISGRTPAFLLAITQDGVSTEIDDIFSHKLSESGISFPPSNMFLCASIDTNIVSELE